MTREGMKELAVAAAAWEMRIQKGTQFDRLEASDQYALRARSNTIWLSLMPGDDRLTKAEVARILAG